MTVLSTILFGVLASVAIIVTVSYMTYVQHTKDNADD